MAGFSPKEILFSPTAGCNLRCLHCTAKKSDTSLSKAAAIRFLADCRRHGIKRVGFTGGEPFLKTDFIAAVSRAAVKEGLLFGRIMTNGSWFKTKKELLSKLGLLKKSGYDGSICVSVDSLHRQDLRKVRLLIENAASIWGRPDIASIAYVRGHGDTATLRILKKLSSMLDRSLFVRRFPIDLSPVGAARKLKDPWRDNKWFKDDLCKGPGNVLMVLPDGSVKPCCGYADSGKLTIGNIKRDSIDKIIKNAANNRFISTVFSSGLGAIRRRLKRSGVSFPGKTKNHCYFCHYILERYYP